jgi:hypothetical protein
MITACSLIPSPFLYDCRAAGDYAGSVKAS